MFAEYFAGSGLLHLPQIALVLFLAVFVGVVVRLYLFRRSGDFDDAARLPFSEDEHV